MKTLLMSQAVLFASALVSCLVICVGNVAEGQSVEAAGSKARILDYSGALSELDKLAIDERNSEQLYLSARILERIGNFTEAAKAFALLDKKKATLPTRLLADAARRRGIVLARIGKCDEALPLLSSASGTKGAAALVTAHKGQCLVAKRRWREALSVLSKLKKSAPETVDLFAVRMQLIEVLSHLQQTTNAKREARRLWVDMPGHPDIETLEKVLKSLGNGHKASVTETLVRAKNLRKARKHEEALVELAKVTPRSKAHKRQWLHLKGMSLYKLRTRYADAAKTLKAASALGGATAIEDAFHAARALSRADKDEAAIRAFRRFVKRYRKHKRAPEALYLSEWLRVRKNPSLGASPMLAVADNAITSPKWRRKALWEAALYEYTQGHFRKAAAILSRSAKPGYRGLVEGKIYYWLGRASEKAGNRQAAIKNYQNAINVEALHWYAQLAATRLKALGQQPKPFTRRMVDKPFVPLPEFPLPKSVALLTKMGLVEDATQAVRDNESAIKAAAPKDRQNESLVAVYQRVGDHKRAYRIAQRQFKIFRSPPSPTTMWAWKAAYPTPWLSRVKEVGAAHSVAPEHVYATMRQESAYDPGAVSHADAIGALQVMPAAAAAIARRKQMSFRRHQLFNPYWNVFFGVEEIAALLKRFGGSSPLAMAAYNAGADRTKRWLGEIKTAELDVFVERIPFNETRGYIRRVTSHLGRYLFLSSLKRGGSGSPWMDLTLEGARDSTNRPQ